MSLRIQTKIIISFLTIFMLVALLGTLAYHNRNLLFNSIVMMEKEAGELKSFSDIRLYMDMAAMPPNDYLITGSPEEKVRFEELSYKFEQALGDMEAVKDGDKGAALGREALEKFKRFKDKAWDIFSLKDPVGHPDGARLMKELDALSDDIIRNDLDKLYVYEMQEVKDVILNAQSVRKTVNWLLLLGGAISVCTVFLTGLYLMRSIAGPIHAFRMSAIKIGGGDLSHRVHIKDGFEMNMLAEEFNKMADRLLESHAGLEKKVEDRTRELNETNRKLKDLSITDGLTGVYNQRWFYEKLDEEIKRSQRYIHNMSVVMADIDFFKQYNDRNGHIEGDGLLKELAACIRSSVRAQDIVARYGGEEFAVILPETDKAGAIRAAERIRESIAARAFANAEGQPGGSLTLSFGLSSFPEDSTSLEELMTKADKALYRAKELGRNRVEAAEAEKQMEIING